MVLGLGGVTAALINTNLGGRALAHALAASKARHLLIGEECLAAYASAAAEKAMSRQ